MVIIDFLRKRKKFNEIAKAIKEIKIQGARNIAKQALYAYNLIPTKKFKKKLLSLRPTEPMLTNVLNKMDSMPYEEILKHFDDAQEKINKKVFKLIKNNDVIFTHCHSTNVSNALIYAKKNGKKFEVYNTETRPLFQGRKTAKELIAHKIKVTMFVDSAGMIALTKSQGTKKVDKVFFGADALLKNGIINKVGSGMFAQIAYDNKIPVYIVADSWKYSPKNIKLEERNFREVWEKISKKSKIKIENPAFEFVPKKFIKKIVTEED
jgi:ribose 1,5-bisphosphate isomerase